MDNTKTTNQTQSSGLNNPAITQAPSQPQPTEPQVPVSGPHKEMGPVIEAPVTEYVAPSSPPEVEPVLAPEVKEAGVESTPDNEVPKLTEEHKKTGLSHAPEAMPVVVNPSSSAVQLPSYTQVQHTVKETPVEESAHWLAMLHKFILERLGAKV